MSLLAYLIPALFLLVIAILFAGGILTIGALSQWLDRKRQMFFSLLLWAIAVGTAVPSLTKPRILEEMDLMNAPLYLGGGGSLAMAGFWVSKILTWLVVLLAAALLVSHFLQSRPVRRLPRQRNATTFLIVGVVSYLVLGSVVNALFGTKPDLDHEMIYPFLLFGVALTLQPEGYQNTLGTIRNVIIMLCVVSLLMAVISPERVLQTGHKGLIPGFSVRLWGAMPHANALGGLSLFYLIIERLAPWKTGLFRWLAWGIVFVTLVLTQSKTNWLIGMALAGLLFALELSRALGEGVRNPRRQQTVAVTLGILVIGVAVAFIILLGIGPETLFARVAGSFEAAGATTLTGRDVIWELAIKEWHANLLFGYGPTMWDADYRLAVGVPYAYHGHNQYLNALARGGLFGMAGVVLMLIAYLYYAVRFFTATQGVLLAALAMILARGFTETPLSIWGVSSQEILINLTLVALIAQLARSEPEAGSIHRREMDAT